MSIRDHIAVFDHDGTLISTIKEIGAILKGHERALAEKFWQRFIELNPSLKALNAEQLEKAIDFATEYTTEKLHNPDEERWVEIARKNAERILESGISPMQLFATLAYSNQSILALLRDATGEDPDRFLALNKALVVFAALEVEIKASFINEYLFKQEDEKRQESTQMFREMIEKTVQDATEDSLSVIENTNDASQSVQGMLGKASEVAAAAEQSAIAMREAAQTAAGLIRAIEEARSEVETSAEVATRASEQAQEAVRVSEALSEHTDSIESILGLIRDVAGQTNLLALNATIEAARAGDAGRGFAVVAQEVKTLANQTAQATDDIANKIAAIQSATAQTVETNESIRTTVNDVQASATRIRQAMEQQAQTVTTITAAVDETALAADSMSGTIAAIREDSESVSSDISRVSDGFREVDGHLQKLTGATGEFVRRMADG
ncbi:chemotaxis protein [Parasphingopyxis algicola]|uniref:methyl-accepting chemotaxis protein n=1 Tax=Parasphingopyxis algicola TaxID=2026624 RepID=UPI00159FF056|nr:methyl-accepting chemotaxis protein [Parasphingopyxis algicola]QLC25135.1 chemotaxis protein [Parasphingopyxis algicola]